MTLDDLVRRLRDAHGDELYGVALYGSAARGGAEHIPEKSDYNVLVLVSTLSMDTLGREAPVARDWRADGNPPPLTLTLSEWRRCVDIYPMEYADILQHHRVLHGTLPLDGIRVDRNQLRLQLESEAMGKLLRLRHLILLAADNRAEQLALLETSLSTMLTLFRAYTRLRGDAPATDSEQLCRTVAAQTGFDASPFIRVWRHLRSNEKLKDADVAPTLSAYLESVQAFVSHVDQYSL
jgi:predicted nucleotidyltransferase